MGGLIGVFGGTFDPPHHGHLILAEEARGQFELDQVFWVLTPDPPHKPDRVITGQKIRIDMVERAISENPHFRLSLADIDRPAPHYALGTMHWLKKHYPDDKFVYLMGGDSLRDLASWYKPVDFIQECEFLGVMHRPGAKPDLDDLERRVPGITEKVRFYQTPLIDIASSDIRSRVAEGRAYRYFLPRKVWRLIENEGLYKGSNSE
jgi:nicotinate-nucleotide adenylyltransferase